MAGYVNHKRRPPYNGEGSCALQPKREHVRDSPGAGATVLSRPRKKMTSERRLEDRLSSGKRVRRASVTRKKPRLATRIPGANAVQAGPVRAVIVDAARRLYQQHGYDAVTMRALAQDIGCSIGSLYTYFHHKNEIFSALQDEGCALFIKWAAGISGGAANALREYFLRYYEFSKAHPEFFLLLWVEHAGPRIPRGHEGWARAVSIGQALAQQALDERIVPSDLTPVAITRVLWSAVQGPAVLGLRYTVGDEGRAECDHLAICLLDLAIAGLQSGAFSGTSSRHPRVATRQRLPNAFPLRVQPRPTNSA
jgi:AcrR family transcriptional regulator